MTYLGRHGSRTGTPTENLKAHSRSGVPRRGTRITDDSTHVHINDAAEVRRVRVRVIIVCISSGKVWETTYNRRLKDGWLDGVFTVPN